MGKKRPMTLEELVKHEEENRRVLGPQWREDLAALRVGGTTSKGYSYERYIDETIAQLDEVICNIVVKSHTPKGSAAGPSSSGPESSRVEKYLETTVEDPEEVICIKKY